MSCTIKSLIYNQINVYYVSPLDINETTINSIDDITIAYLSWCSHNTIMIILKLHVNPNYTHQAYGTCLLKYAINKAIESHNFTMIELDDMSDNVWNLGKNIYINCGFRYKNEFPFPEMELILPINNMTSSFENMKLDSI